MSAGLTAQQLSQAMNLSLRTIQADIQQIKERFPDRFFKERIYRVPIDLLEKHYGFERADLIKIMHEERNATLATMQRDGFTAAELALCLRRPYLQVLPLVHRMKSDHADKCDVTSFRVPVPVIRVSLCSNILDLVPAAIAMANTRRGIDEAMKCTDCQRNLHYCATHKPYQHFLTPENNIRVTDSWKRARRSVQVELFPQFDNMQKYV